MRECSSWLFSQAVPGSLDGPGQISCPGQDSRLSFSILMPILRNGHLQVQRPENPRKRLIGSYISYRMRVSNYSLRTIIQKLRKQHWSGLTGARKVLLFLTYFQRAPSPLHYTEIQFFMKRMYGLLYFIKWSIFEWAT